MLNVKLTLEYDGGKFYGWQYQPKLRTVQGELERALEIFLREKVHAYVAGRTDTGVHALGQVSNFKTNIEVDPNTIPRSLNGILPHDVVVKHAELVPLEFHARYDALSRQYRYVISRYPVAVGRGYAYFSKFPLDLEAMKNASQHLLGEHNFRAFCSGATEDPHYLSNVEEIAWEDNGDKIYMSIRANRFLRSMVRVIVGSLLQVGRGKMAPDDIAKILAAQNRVAAGVTAPPHGLFLEKVFYAPDHIAPRRKMRFAEPVLVEEEE
jgi:tRNA pseudouridine38-40 synthase